MRIKSNFHDYYDVGQSTGQDQTRLYLRYRKEIVLDTSPGIPYIYSFRGGPDHIRYVQSIVGFCGKLYPVIEVNTPDHWRCDTKECRDTRKFCFSLEDIDKWVRLNVKEKYHDGYFHKWKPTDRWRKGGRKHWSTDEWRPCFENFFEKFDECRDKHGELFIKHQCPILTFKSEYKAEKRGYETTLILNPCLKDFEFFRVFDPYQAYQEIAMFFGNLAEPRKPIPPIDDKTMAEIKGFDKFSFRKDKQIKA